MSAQHDDDLHEGTPGYKLSQPKQSLAAYQQMGPCSLHTASITKLLCPSCLVLTTMDSVSVRSRSVSINVPAPPPSSPYCDGLERKNSMVVTIEDIEELMRILRSKTNTPVSEDDEDSPPVGRAFSLAPAPAPAPNTASASACSASTSTVDCCQLKEEATASGSDADCLSQESTTTMLTLPADAGDESLQRYKESLGLGGGKDLSDPNDPRVCIIHSLTLESPGRDPVTIDLSVPGSEATLKDHPFTIKEGSRFTMVATFKVQHEVLSGLRYVQVVKRKGVRVGKDSEMLGSYAPSTDKQPLYTKRFQEDEAPSGMLARGHYVASSSFVDDDKKTHLAFEWSFDIAKDW
ncbi:rho GDP dissociation inhibitor [Sporothrix eucalyptigena]|uniref:Rho GDP dissociation inhibitor n=1 Tax=Sporothrix eucalyptigena TaxID=1812306 RepID=A0ABP0CH73_9PEZI